MVQDTNRVGLLAGIGLWILAALVQGVFQGFLNGFTNPFLWILSWMEAVEFLAWLSGPGSLGFFLENLGGRESGLILSGLAASLAWLVTVVFGYRYVSESKSSNLYLVGLVWFYPVVAVATAVYLVRIGTGEKQPEGEPASGV